MKTKKHNEITELTEQLLDFKAERPNEHTLRTHKQPTLETKQKAAEQRKAIRRDLAIDHKK